MKVPSGRRRSRKAGLPPGTLIHIGERRLDRTRMSIIGYDEAGVSELPDATVEECVAAREKAGVAWIDVEGIHDVAALERLEDELMAHPSRQTLRKIYQLKRDMLFLRKSIWPLRELVSSLDRDESPLVGEPIRKYLRDVHDHAVSLVDAIETYRDMLSGMLDIYLSSMSNRLNEVMKVLTIIATLFIPLTFLAGIYGMNFVFMPELGWRWGYPAVLGAMAAVAGAMIVFFRRKKWI